MKKLLLIAGVIVALVITGCPTDDDGDGGQQTTTTTDPAVTSIALRIQTGSNPAASTNPTFLRVGDVRTFSAVVTGNAYLTDKTYDLDFARTDAGNESALAALITIDAVTSGDTDSKKVTVNSDGITGKFKVTAKSKADPNFTPASWEIEVREEAPAIDFPNSEWKIKNTVDDRTGVTRNASTTTSVTAATVNGKKRYVVFNNEPGAQIDQDASLAVTGGSPNSFRDVTIVYNSQPIYPDSTAFKTFGIQARVKVTKLRDSGSQSPTVNWDVGREGVVIGMITDPEAIDLSFDATGLAENGENAPAFFGLRRLIGGRHRTYMKTNNPSQYSSVQISADAGETNEIVTGTQTYAGQFEQNSYENTHPYGTFDPAKIAGFAEQEYVFKVMRSGLGTYRVEIYDPTGTTLLLSKANVIHSTGIHADMTGDTPMYLGFLVYGVEAEFSEITIFYDGNQSWTDPAVSGTGAEPEDAKALRVAIASTATHKMEGDEENDYSCLGAEFTGITLTPSVLPFDITNRAVNWSMTGTSVEFDTPNATTYAIDVARNAQNFGTSVLTATPAAGGNAGTYQIYLHNPDDVVIPSTVTIHTPVISPTVYLGETVQFHATVGAVGAPQAVKWSVDNTTIASIDEDTGLLEIIQDVASPTSITVTVTPDGYPAVTDTKAVNVIPKPLYFSRTWTFGDPEAELAGVPIGLITDAKALLEAQGWENKSADPRNTTDIDLGNGLKLNGSTGNGNANGINWNPGQDTIRTLTNSLGLPARKGVLQPTSSATNAGWGEIDVSSLLNGGPNSYYRVSVIYTNTGDNRNNTRYLWIEFENEGGRATNPVNMYEGNGASATSMDDVTWSHIGKGKAKFGSAEGALRIVEVRVDELQSKVWAFGSAVHNPSGATPPTSLIPGWVNGTADPANVTDTEWDGLSLYGATGVTSVNGFRWDQTGAGLANVYEDLGITPQPLGVLQPGTASPAAVGFGKVDITDLLGTGTGQRTYKLDVIFTNTGDNRNEPLVDDVTAGAPAVQLTRFPRWLWIAFPGEDPSDIPTPPTLQVQSTGGTLADQGYNTWVAAVNAHPLTSANFYYPSNGGTAAANTLATKLSDVVHSRVGKGPVRFGSAQGALRIWRVTVWY